MKLVIDTAAQTLTEERDGAARVLPLYSKESFELVANEFVRLSWNEKYPYTFSWMGRPIIQLPEDVLRMQEVIYRLRPNVIIETGVAHGGSLIFYASLCKAMECGRVVGVDIEIRPQNRSAIESHELSSFITLIEGSSVDAAVVAKVGATIKPDDVVLVILDSNHTRAHVLEELALYSPMVSSGSYIVATDGIMGELADVPRGRPEWKKDNPTQAALEFASKNPSFVLEQPAWPFNESELDKNITYWPGAWLRKR